MSRVARVIRTLSYLPRRLSRRVVCGLALRIPRCAGLLDACVPLSIRSYPDDAGQSSDRSSRTLLVFLPGIGDLMEDYELNGFLMAAKERRAAADLVLVDAHYGYYANRTILDRLREDVIDPAKRRGYDEIWLVGISLGGLGALLYATRNPGHITGLVLLAPFLGPSAVIEEIARAGGLKAWNPEGIADTLADDDYQRPLWRWLKEHAAHSQASTRPVIHLAYGEHDRFAPAHRLLAEILPPGQVLSVRGGHDWTTWNRLWQALLLSPECGFLR